MQSNKLKISHPNADPEGKNIIRVDNQLGSYPEMHIIPI